MTPRNIKIIIEYDGTDFSGWQFQPRVRTVQGALQDAVRQITQETVVVEGAGRTDAGVHARAQVGNFKIFKSMTLADLSKGLNAVLPDDVRIVGIEEAAIDFHARFSARERRYRYTISRRPAAIGRHQVWSYPHPLDIERMSDACRYVIGEKNFRSFCLSEAEVNHYRCDVRHAAWTADGTLIYFDIHANRFLHTMVRCLVGTFVQIGRGKMSADELQVIIEKEDRRVAGYTAPARGLCLEAVMY